MSEQETCAPIGYLRVQNVFSLDSHSKEIIQLKQINSYPHADMYHPFNSKVSIVFVIFKQKHRKQRFTAPKFSSPENNSSSDIVIQEHYKHFLKKELNSVSVKKF